MTYLPPFNGGRINATISGNTAGVGSLVSSGILTLAGGNNVTLSQAGNAITISGANAPSGSINFSAGTTSANLAAITFANSGNVSFGLSGSSITGSYSQTVQTQNLMTVNGTQGNVSISGGANITVNNNASSILISAAPMFDAGVWGTAAGGATAGATGSNTNGLAMYAGSNMTLSQATDINGASVTFQAGGGVALAGGGATFNSGTANLIGSGGVSVNSTTGQSFIVSGPTVSSLSVTGAVSISTNVNTISIGAPLNGTVSNWEPLPANIASMGGQTMTTNGIQYFYKLQPEAYINASQMMQLVSVSLSSMAASSFNGAHTFMAGIYTATGSSLSLATQSSGSVTYAWTNSSNNSFNSLTGLRGITMPMNVSMTPGNYWIGMWQQTASGGANWATISNMVFTNNTSATYNGIFGASAVASAGVQEGVGYYSVTSASLLASVAMSQLVQSNFRSNFMQYVAFKNTSW